MSLQIASGSLLQSRGLHSILVAVLLSSGATAQDMSPLRDYLVWLPMTGFNAEQAREAVAAGYTAAMLKISPSWSKDGKALSLESVEQRIQLCQRAGMKVILACLASGGMRESRFWDVEESGKSISNTLDPFNPEAMAEAERYYSAIMYHYRDDRRVVAFAPTWGIYGEAGFTSWTAGRSEHALKAFNAWRNEQKLPALDRLPTRQNGPNTDFNLFIRFRYLHLERAFAEMVNRLKPRAAGRPVGMWQELYPVAGYLWTMVQVPTADFALYESCIPYQTVHHPERCLAETMGFRYRCKSADEYRDYYLPLLARKRGEGQRFMGCQLSNDYATRYGWSLEQARERGFDRWEDEFAPHLKKLMDEPLESPTRDVLLVFPQYAAAALPDDPRQDIEAKLWDVLLRMYGCQMCRYGLPRVDKLTVAELDRFRLIVVPASAFLMSETFERLKATRATVVFTGCFGQALDGKQVPVGQSRKANGLTLSYENRPAGAMRVEADHPLTRHVDRTATTLPADESFSFFGDGVQCLVRCSEQPLISIANQGRHVFTHGSLLAGLCYDPQRKPPMEASGSTDASANEVDTWGPYSSSQPGNRVAELIVRNILDYANVEYRVPTPLPRTCVPFLGDHMEQASVSANLVYNNTSETQNLTVRLPFSPAGYNARSVEGRYEATVEVPAFSYVALQGF